LRVLAQHTVARQPLLWEYVNPFFGKPFFGGPPTSESNQVFRAIRHSADEIARARRLG
jgi:hypothetical protein